MKKFKTGLNPKRYRANVCGYYKEHTHCKMIITDTIAYIGSQNFTEASKDNYECGIITKDIELIKAANNFFEKIKKDSTLFYSNQFQRNKNEVENVFNILSQIIKKEEENGTITKIIESLKEKTELNHLEDSDYKSSSLLEENYMFMELRNDLNNLCESLKKLIEVSFFKRDRESVYKTLRRMNELCFEIKNALEFDDISYYYDYTHGNIIEEDFDEETCKITREYIHRDNGEDHDMLSDKALEELTQKYSDAISNLEEFNKQLFELKNYLESLINNL